MPRMLSSAHSTAVTALTDCAEKVAFDAGLDIARANTKDVGIARDALKVVEDGSDAVLGVGGWMVQHMVNILDLEKVEVTGDLRGLCKDGTQLKAHLVGTLADERLDFGVDFLPAKGRGW